LIIVATEEIILRN